MASQHRIPTAAALLAQQIGCWLDRECAGTLYTRQATPKLEGFESQK